MCIQNTGRAGSHWKRAQDGRTHRTYRSGLREREEMSPVPQLMAIRAEKHLNYPDVFPHLKHDFCHDIRGGQTSNMTPATTQEGMGLKHDSCHETRGDGP